MGGICNLALRAHFGPPTHKRIETTVTVRDKVTLNMVFVVKSRRKQRVRNKDKHQRQSKTNSDRPFEEKHREIWLGPTPGLSPNSSTQSHAVSTSKRGVTKG